ncbi:MAG TPA: hypothetical protein VGG23_10935, partial [Acidimicrobiales bacterium]
VDARSLANLYAQYMGNVFTHEMKPLEVEILVAEVGSEPGGDQLFHILYDGFVVDEGRLTALGGEADAIAGRLEAGFDATWDLPSALRAAVAALAGPDRSLGAGDLEVAVLARSSTRRAFRRIGADELAGILAGPGSSDAASSDAGTGDSGTGDSGAAAETAETGADKREATTDDAAPGAPRRRSTPSTRRRPLPGPPDRGAD